MQNFDDTRKSSEKLQSLKSEKFTFQLADQISMPKVTPRMLIKATQEQKKSKRRRTTKQEKERILPLIQMIEKDIRHIEQAEGKKKRKPKPSQIAYEIYTRDENNGNLTQRRENSAQGRTSSNKRQKTFIHKLKKNVQI